MSQDCLARIGVWMAVVVATLLPGSFAHSQPVTCGSDQPDVLLIADAAAANQRAGQTDHAQHASAPVTGTPIDFFTNDGNYMPRVHCLRNEAGQPDWPWIITLIALTSTVVIGYVRIFIFWRRAYLDEAPQDRNKKMMQLAYIFLFCAVCGYAFSLLAYFWPAYRLLAVFLFVLNVFTWGFAFSLKDFRLSLSANRMRRELIEQAENKAIELERLVNERTTALNQVREETRQLALVAASTDNAVIITDRAGRITWVNRSFTRISGYSMDQVLGKKPGSFLQGPDTDPQTVARIRRAIAARESITDEILNYSVTGEPYWMAIEIQPIHDDEDRLTHFIAIQSDITAEKALKHELAQAKENAESANKAKSQFIANMSHEIRTPLTGIIGFADLLANKQQIDDAMRKDWAKTILSSSRHLQTLLNDVLDISKIEAGKLEIEKLPINPHDIISEIASIFCVNATNKGLSLEVACPNPLPETIHTDPTRLRQALSNLVGNAIKFTDAGSIRIEADIVKHAIEPRELLRIDVVDTGPGMSSGEVDKLFQCFAQADISVTRKYGGTGLGLAISKHLANALGGDLTVESRRGFGSRFMLTIDPGNIESVPRVRGSESHTDPALIQKHIDQRADQSHPEDQDDEPAANDTSQSDRPQILLADDGPTNRKFISIALGEAGYTVTAVENGKLALETLLADPERYDLVLMDMQMPEMDGYEATQAIREAGIQTPIVALTASVLKGDRERCLQAGCQDYLSKPIEPNQLLRDIERILNDKKPAQADHPDALIKTDSDRQPGSTDGPIRSNLSDDVPDHDELIEFFASELETHLDTARSALEQSDAAALSSIAHKIVGSGAMMGYKCLTDPAVALKDAADEHALEQAAACLKELQSLCERIQKGSKPLPPADEPSTTPATAKENPVA